MTSKVALLDLQLQPACGCVSAGFVCVGLTCKIGCSFGYKRTVLAGYNCNDLPVRGVFPNNSVRPFDVHRRRPRGLPGQQPVHKRVSVVAAHAA